MKYNCITYRYHKVMTRLVRFPPWSEENDLARPKSASFSFPSLSIKRLEPAKDALIKMDPLATNSYQT